MRIDDDSSADRAQDARAAERKAQEQQQKRRADEVTAFDKKLQGTKEQTTFASRQAQSEQKSAKDLIKSLLAARPDETVDGQGGALDHATREGMADAEHFQEARGDQQKMSRAAAGMKDVDRKTGRLVSEGRGDDAHVDAGQAEAAHTGQVEGEGRASVKRDDGRTDERREQGRDDQKGGAPGKSSRPGQKVGERQRDQSGQQGGNNSQNQNPGAFRLPPAALMAPPPVAVPKGEGGQVSRLREMAKEIAEKIVQHARVGTNRMGLPEFQIELKSEILKGLKVKVSGRHGRIRALFQSRDLAVLKQLRGEVESLRAALSARGLKVDALEIEEERT